jgi:hypothetical protein
MNNEKIVTRFRKRVTFSCHAVRAGLASGAYLHKK